MTGCEVYNLGTGKGTSVLEMVAAFEKASGKVFLPLSFAFLPRNSTSLDMIVTRFRVWLDPRQTGW